MTDKLGVAARIEVKLRLHWEQTQHAVDLMHDFVHPFAPPRPHRRADIMDSGDARLFEFFRDNMSSVKKISLGSEGEIVSDINSNIRTSEANLQGKITVVNSSGEYLTKKGKTSEIISGNVKGN